MNCFFLEEEIDSYLKKIKENVSNEEIDFETFARLIAILLEEKINLRRREGDENEEMQYDEE